MITHWALKQLPNSPVQGFEFKRLLESWGIAVGFRNAGRAVTGREDEGSLAGA